MRKLGPGGIALVPVAEVCPLAAGRVLSATVVPCRDHRDCRPAEPARLTTAGMMERVSVTKDTL
jgi:hypothetical protein